MRGRVRDRWPRTRPTPPTGGQHMSVTVVAVPGDRRTLIAAGHELSRLLEPHRWPGQQMRAPNWNGCDGFLEQANPEDFDTN